MNAEKWYKILRTCLSLQYTVLSDYSLSEMKRKSGSAYTNIYLYFMEFRQNLANLEQ